MEDSKKLKILLLEDNPDDASLVQRVLKKDHLEFVSECVDTRDEFSNAIRKFRPDVILSDHGLPGFNSNEALKIALKVRPTIPFILVTGTVNDEYAISCLREGADDYILKSNLSRLPMAIRGAIKRKKLEKMKREARHALRIQNEALLKVNQELDNFVYSVSHNLRGPLATLMGLLNVVKEEDRDRKLGTVHSMMERSMLKLDDTLQEIIEYSYNARSELSCISINWTEVISSCFQKLEYLDGSCEIEKFIHLKTEIPFFCDSKRLGVIFSILFSNAILYQDKKREPMISVEVITKSDAAVITVVDNGMGIRNEIRPRVFEMFYRGSEKSQGAGLGLYIAKEIVGRLNGHIHLESVYGQGTTVKVTLPNSTSSGWEQQFPD